MSVTVQQEEFDKLETFEECIYDKTVSVLMLAYNHGDYIVEAIESILKQECTFSFVLVIGEDCSTDNTRSICERYAEKFPDKIRLLPSERNYGIQGNFLRTLENCFDSEYIAFCEGDDKWSDINKLQYQVEFLRNNLEYVAHAHNVIYRDLRNGKDRPFGVTKDGTCLQEELFNTWPFHVCSLFVRTTILKAIPIKDLPYFISGDKFLCRWLASHGAVYYEGSNSMAIYHRHQTGASENSNYFEVCCQNLEMLDFLEPYIKQHRILSEAKKIAIERLYMEVASMRPSPFSIRKRLKDLLRYVQIISIYRMNKSNIYFMLLIIFNRNPSVHKIIKNLLWRL